MTHEELIQQMNSMPNGERIKFFVYLSEHHFGMTPISDEESQIIEDLRDGYLKVVAND